jgi:hypothetical protein
MSVEDALEFVDSNVLVYAHDASSAARPNAPPLCSTISGHAGRVHPGVTVRNPFA